MKVWDVVKKIAKVYVKLTIGMWAFYGICEYIAYCISTFGSHHGFTPLEYITTYTEWKWNCQIIPMGKEGETFELVESE